MELLTEVISGIQTSRLQILSQSTWALLKGINNYRNRTYDLNIDTIKNNNICIINLAAGIAAAVGVNLVIFGNFPSFKDDIMLAKNAGLPGYIGMPYAMMGYITLVMGMAHAYAVVWDLNIGYNWPGATVTVIAS